MKVTKEYTNVKCDNCGKLMNEESYFDIDDLCIDEWYDGGWTHTKDGKDYCPDCLGFGREGSNDVIDENRKDVMTKAYERHRRKWMLARRSDVGLEEILEWIDKKWDSKLSDNGNIANFLTEYNIWLK